MKSIRSFLIGIVISGSLAAGFHFLHAQETAMPTQLAAPDSIVQLTADAQGLVLMAPVDLPRSGTFWVIMPGYGGGVTALPYPCMTPALAGLPVYGVTDNAFLVDDTGGQVMAGTQRAGRMTANMTVESALESQASAVVNLINMVQGVPLRQMSQAMGMDAPAFDGGGDGGGGTNGFYSDSFNYTLPTNGLWLEMTNVANGLASLNLHGATDQVYEIWSKTNLSDAAWNIASEVFPTDTNCTPFVLSLNPQSSTFFVWARDWTGVTSGGNQTPEWWFWKYFGTVNVADGDLDSSSGHTLLDDYNSGTDPNVISFALWSTGRYVNHPWAPLQISLSGGVPFYAATLVNDTNLSDASWQPYTGSNVVVTLGGGDGIYGVRLGLRGLPADAQQTWNNIAISFTLDRSAPVVTITNPVASSVSTPTIQVQGFASKQLSSLTFDVSNAAGIFTNQTGYVTGAFYDTNLPAFTTNYFQCYDVALTNGVNIITLHATDLAGNTTTTNVSVTSDYSGNNQPPALSVTWPQDGTYISGSQFTFHGAVDKAGATITATIVDAGGDTNLVQGLVEQNGTVWAQNLPLAAGANTLTLTATDAAGTNTTQLTLYQSSVTVTLNPLAGGQLNQSSVNVTGTVSDPSYSVSVNGVGAYYVDDAGDWEADGVPVSSSGTAIFDVEVYSGGTSSAVVRPGLKSSLQPADAGSDSGIGSEQFALALPVKVGMMSYLRNEDRSDQFPHEHSMVPPIGGPAYGSGDDHEIWNYRSGGLDAGHDFFSGDYTYWNPPGDDTWSDPLPAGQDNFNAPWESVSAGEAGQSGNWTFITFHLFAWQYDAQARVMLEPPGQQATGITNYYLVQAQAWGFSDPYDEWDTAWPLSPDTLQIGGVPLTLATNADGSVWGQRLVAGRAGQNVEVTPTAPTQNYLFSMQAFTLDRVMAVDNNRDGWIAFDNNDATSPQLPFRFWVNDSQEGGDISTPDNDVPGSSTPNYANNQVNGRADVVNFFPVAFNLSSVFEQWPLTNSEYHLSQADSGVKIVYTGLTQASAFDYLNDPLTPDTYGTNFDEALTNADTIQVLPSDATTGTKLDTNWLAQIQNNNGGQCVLLMEGCKTSAAPLNLEIWQNGQMVQAMSCYISVSGAEQMYRWVNLRGAVGGSVSKPTNISPPQNLLDAECDGKQFVFVHGYSVSETAARGWGAEMFKRLYQADSHAMFTAVTWFGDDGWQVPGWIPFYGGDRPDYYTNVANAFLTASNLTVAVNALPGQKYIAGHSLGNMVVSSAIADWGLNVNAYFMIDAAVPMEAYNASASDNLNLVPPPWWINYSNRLWASKWYLLFDSSDARSTLTWSNRFVNIPNAFNYYSSTEDVLTNADGQLHSVTGQEFCWVNQEMRKGSWLAGLVANDEAGWGFNSLGLNGYSQYTIEQADNIPDSQLRTNSFFGWFDDANLYTPDGGSDAANYNLRAQILSDGIPALSNAAGANDLGAVITSHNMNDDKGLNIDGLWPIPDDCWHHSDIIYVSYSFNHAVFNQIVNDGNLW